MKEVIKVMMTEQEIDARVRQIGEQISKDYAGQEAAFLCVNWQNVSQYL